MKFVKCENEDVFDIKRMYSAGFHENVKLSHLHFAYMGEQM